MQASIGKADRKMEDRNISVPDLSVSSFQAVHQARISPAKGRIQQARAKPPKATTRPPQGHILGIDSGVQSHHKAIPRPPQSHILWSTEAPQSHPKATPRLPTSEGRRQKEERAGMASPSHPQAANKPSAWEVIGRELRPSSYAKAKAHLSAYSRFGRLVRSTGLSARSYGSECCSCACQFSIYCLARAGSLITSKFSALCSSAALVKLKEPVRTMQSSMIMTLLWAMACWASMSVGMPLCWRKSASEYFSVRWL